MFVKHKINKYVLCETEGAVEVFWLLPVVFVLAGCCQEPPKSKFGGLSLKFGYWQPKLSPFAGTVFNFSSN